MAKQIVPHHKVGSMVWVNWPIVAPARITMVHIQPGEERKDGLPKLRGYSYEMMIGLPTTRNDESGMIMYGYANSVLEAMTPQNKPNMFFRLRLMHGYQGAKFWKAWIGPSWGNAGVGSVMSGRPDLNELEHDSTLMTTLWKAYNGYNPTAHEVR